MNTRLTLRFYFSHILGILINEKKKHLNFQPLLLHLSFEGWFTYCLDSLPSLEAELSHAALQLNLLVYFVLIFCNPLYFGQKKLNYIFNIVELARKTLEKTLACKKLQVVTSPN